MKVATSAVAWVRMDVALLVLAIQIMDDFPAHAWRHSFLVHILSGVHGPVARGVAYADGEPAFSVQRLR